MKFTMQWVVWLLVWVVGWVAYAQQPTSRVIRFNNVATTIPAGTTGQALTIQLWDAATTPPGNLVFSEAQTLDVGSDGTISFVFGSQTANGLDPANFASGSSRFLDVVDASGNSALPSGRLPLNATGFALSPGPQGPPGQVQSVSAADGSIAVGGTVVNPTIAVAPNGITNANVADGALSPAKIAGMAATLGPNTFVGNQSVTGNLSASGLLSLPTTANATTGVIALGGAPFVHNFGTNNTFVGASAGNFTMSGFGGNTASGASALSSNTTGFQNTASGAGTLTSNTTGRDNAASGWQALLSNTTGSGNTASGSQALRANSTGFSNTASGLQALSFNTTGFQNTASGSQALANNTGNNNTASGSQALFSNTTGSGNTALGLGAGAATPANANTTGSNNTFIGFLTGPGVPSSTPLTNATAIGANATVNASNSLALGGTGANAVNVGIGTAAPAFRLDVAGTGNFSGAVTANSFTGNGSGLTNLPAANLTGTVPSAAVSGAYASALAFTNAANSFTGNGSGLTSLPAANLTGTVPSAALSGAYPSALAFPNAANAFTGAFSGNGAGLLNLDATHLTNGIRVQQSSISPNIISGFSGNSVAGGVYGATIAGGA